jgi:hypothetical protein
MAKSLIQQVKELPAIKSGSWLDALTDTQRKEIDDLIDGWKAGQWRDKLPKKAHLARFIESQPFVKSSEYPISRYIKKRIADGNR